MTEFLDVTAQSLVADWAIWSLGVVLGLALIAAAVALVWARLVPRDYATSAWTDDEPGVWQALVDQPLPVHHAAEGSLSLLSHRLQDAFERVAARHQTAALPVDELDGEVWPSPGPQALTPVVDPDSGPEAGEEESPDEMVPDLEPVPDEALAVWNGLGDLPQCAIAGFTESWRTADVERAIAAARAAESVRAA